MIHIGKLLILSFEKNEEHILREILRIVHRQPEYAVRELLICNSVVQLGNLIIDVARKKVIIAGKEIRLSGYEFGILYLLAKKPGWIYTKEQIYELVWKEPADCNFERVRHIISNLRTKIEPDRSHPIYIKTIRDFGYKLNEQLCEKS